MVICQGDDAVSPRNYPLKMYFKIFHFRLFKFDKNINEYK